MSYDSPAFVSANLQYLHQSPWKIAVSEMGLGVGLTDLLLSAPGASNTVLFSETPYHRAFQPAEIAAGRSVSLEMSRELCNGMRNKLREQGKGVAGPVVLVGITGAHKTADEAGETHAWITIQGAKDEGSVDLHFWLDPETSRSDASRLTGKIAFWLLEWFLFRPTRWQDWLAYCPLQPADGGIDLVREIGLSFEDRLALLHPRNPLYFNASGGMQRAVDHFRGGTIYRGSFNPPTLAHTYIASQIGATLELSVTNARKGKISIADAVHRIKMLNLLERGVLVTEGCPLFTDLHQLLYERAGKSACRTYAMGLDTWKALFHQEFVPDAETFSDFLSEAQFEVGMGTGEVFPEIVWEGIKQPFPLPIYDVPAFRSTEIRQTISKREPCRGVDPQVLRYIYANNLYQYEVAQTRTGVPEGGC